MAGAPLLMRHAALLRRLEQAAVRHRGETAVVAAAGASWTQQQRQACSSSCSSPPAAATSAPLDRLQQHRHHHHHQHQQPYPLPISASTTSSSAPSIWRQASSPPSRPPPPPLQQARHLSLLAGLANLVNPTSDSTTTKPHQTATRRAHRERRLVGYAPEQLFGVVADVARYSEFVPWCRRSVVLRSSPDGKEMEAELEVGFQALSERYVSRVRLQRPPAVAAGAAAGTATPTTTTTTTPTPPLAVVEATTSRSMLFEHLASTWALRPGPQPGTTWLSFAVEFGFASPAHRHVADLFFDQVVRRMVAAFEGRCCELYGPSVLDRRRSEGMGRE
jgi:ribosome-associated toxin RatA of RatAB toxin-antitoxin module